MVIQCLHIPVIVFDFRLWVTLGGRTASWISGMSPKQACSAEVPLSKTLTLYQVQMLPDGLCRGRDFHTVLFLCVLQQLSLIDRELRKEAPGCFQLRTRNYSCIKAQKEGKETYEVN